MVYALAVAMYGETEAKWAEITEEVQALVNDMPAKKSSGMEVMRYPGYENYVWIKASYTLDGGIKGKDLNKQYHDFVYNYSEKLYNKIYKIMEDHE